MSVSAITGPGAVAPTAAPAAPASTSGTAQPGSASAQPLTSGTQPPLSPEVLAALIGEQISLYGSFSGS